MRLLAPLALAAALGLSTGCYVFDELDNGQKILKQYGGQTPHAQPAAPAAEPAEEPKDEGPGLLARLEAFWEKKREAPEPQRSPDDGIVTCRLGGETTFTYRSDCLSRGGQIR
jgi:hypothetical protein